MLELVTPGFGLTFWMVITFVILMFILKKFAWKPILDAVNERESNITRAMEAAEEAKKEMELLKASNEDLLKEARAERDAILKEAREMKDSIVNDAKDKANTEAAKIVAEAKDAIRNEKASAMAELKSQVASLSIEIAEKVVKEKLSSDDKQKELVSGLVQEVTLN